MGYIEFKGKTIEEAVTAASVEFGIPSADLEYEVVEKGSLGFLGIGAKPAIIRAKKKEETIVDSLQIKHSIKNSKIFELDRSKSQTGRTTSNRTRNSESCGEN